MQHFLLILVNKILLILRRTQIAIGISNMKYRQWDSVQVVRPIGGVEVWLCPFLTAALEGGEGSASLPGRSLPPGNSRYTLYRRLGGPQGRSGQVRETSLPLGFDSRNVQPVASRYTGYATRPTSNIKTSKHSLTLTNSKPIPTFPLAFQSTVLTICTNFVNF